MNRGGSRWFKNWCVDLYFVYIMFIINNRWISVVLNVIEFVGFSENVCLGLYLEGNFKLIGIL